MAPTRARALAMLFVLLNIFTFTMAASSSAFCKCTCFGNSTIIDLNGGASTTPVAGSTDTSQKTVRTCNDCTKQLCLEYHLPICKDAEAEDVFTQCFWRDSAKDQTVVFIFIFATVGLLAWAGVKPWVQKWSENIRERRSYTPVSGQTDH